MESCRLCLQSDVKLHRMVSTPLRKFIEQIFKQNGFYNDLHASDYVCYMCQALLHKSYKFIQMTLDAQKVLYDPLYCEQEITFPDFKPSMRLDFEYFNYDIPPSSVLNCTSDNISSETDSIIEINDSDEEFDTSNVKQEVDSTEQEQSENIDYSNTEDKSCIDKFTEELEVDMKVYRKSRNSNKLKELIENEDIFGITPEMVNKEDPDYSVKKKYVSVKKNESKNTKKKLQKVKKRRRKRKTKVIKDDRDFPMECELCDGEVSSKQEHYRHYMFEHPNETYPYGHARALCPMCGASVSKIHIDKHLQSHGKRKFKCHICSKKYTSRQTMLAHIRVTHSEPKLICDYCVKPFKTKTDIIRHIRIHTGEKPFKCHICDAAFAHSGNRAIHIRSSHQNIKIVPKKTANKNNKDVSRKRKSRQNDK